jgi:hypothetical protein
MECLSRSNDRTSREGGEGSGGRGRLWAGGAGDAAGEGVMESRGSFRAITAACIP